eukprot:CAMPEP_0194027060 /NCGR_PEP_ID=MMETSP0009_2-20130614/1288_1 /TAXON_ID=210454 /ORGANISM="Grammatophora oceanica, Strain CCMP 410" /LENGTH=426 /DNA_ID=CAMNT_0038666007 /DNA_START=16 /DNA_END=1296 /DNA_ORIENTATION=-
MAVTSSQESASTRQTVRRSQSVVRSASSDVVESIRKRFRKDDLTFEELKRLERRRRAILRRNELPFWRVLAFWDGTSIRLLTKDPLVWITMAIYVGVRIQSRFGIPDFVSDITTSDIGVIGGFLSFFLVFFVVQANERFDAQYRKSMDVERGVFDIATLAKATLSKAAGHRLNRYLNAAHLCGYIGLSDTYTSENFFRHVNESHRIVTEKEMVRLRLLGMDEDGSAYRELLTWAMLEVQTVFEAGKIDPRLASHYREKINETRTCLDSLFEYSDQPISFFYLHFLSLLSALYLPLFAVSSAYDAGTGDEIYWTADVLSGLIVVLQVIFVIGLRLLGQKMIDPFGEDLEDLSVMHYVTYTWMMSNRILNAEAPTPLDEEEEDEMVKDRASIGKAWGGKGPNPGASMKEEIAVLEEEDANHGSKCVIQ